MSDRHASAAAPVEPVVRESRTGALQGLPGDPGPMSVLMAAHNRYLLRIDD